MTTFNFRLVGHQRIVQSVGVPGMHAGSKVFATVSEFAQDRGTTFIGAARIYLCNLSARPDGIDIWVQVDWDHDLIINVDLLII